MKHHEIHHKTNQSGKETMNSVDVFAFFGMQHIGNHPLIFPAFRSSNYQAILSSHGTEDRVVEITMFNLWLVVTGT